jgi:hypothetical protein
MYIPSQLSWLMQTTTDRLEEDARERLADKTKVPLNDILERWKCRSKACKNFDFYCFVDAADNTHYAFDSSDASRWAKTIPHSSSIDRPSDRLRAILVRKAKKASNGSDANIQTSMSSGNGGTVNNFNITLPTPGRYMDRRLGTIHSPENTPNRPRMPSTSPARSEVDWRAETDRYFEYLTKKFPGDTDKLLAAKQTLLVNDVDLKSYKDVDHEALEIWDITWGIMKKICRDVKVFQMEDIY